MFLANVLVGESVCGKEHYHQVGPRTGSWQATLRLMPQRETLFATQKPSEHLRDLPQYQCYPYFLIYYRMLSDPVRWLTALEE